MADISAKQVMALREKTGLPMMDVKKALVESAGDEAAAIEILRQKFKDKMTNKADRVASNGRIGAYANDTRGALVEVRCETDFVGTNDVFKAFSNDLARQVVETGITDIAKLMESNAAFAGDRPLKALLEDCFAKVGEKLEVAHATLLDGHCGTYVHHNGLVGSLVSTDKPIGDVGRQICMHIASRQSDFWLTRAEVPANMVEEEKAKATEEVKGKPAEIAGKIVEGKLNKWYAELVLPEQAFALDDKKTVAAAAKEAGGVITGYRRMEVGRVA